MKGPRLGRGLAAAFGVSICVVSSVALADPASRVVVVRSAHPSATVDEANTRLRAELTASGFEVVSVDAKEGLDPRESVENPELRSVAALSIVNTKEGTAIDLWVADRLTQKTLVRRIDVASPSSRSSAVVLAIRAVELLRASLLEAESARAVPADVARFVHAPIAPALPVAPIPPAAVPAPAPLQGSTGALPSPSPANPPSAPSAPPSVPRAASSWPSAGSPQPMLNWPSRPWNPSAGASETDGHSKRLVSFGAAFAVLHHFDAQPPSLSPELTFQLHVDPRLTLRADVVAPLFTWDRARPEGSISLREGLGTVGAAVPLVLEGPLVPSTYLGLGVDVAHAAGEARAPYVGASSDVASFVVMPGASVEWFFTPHVSLLTDARISFALPGATLRIAGHDVGRIGRSSFLGALGISVSP